MRKLRLYFGAYVAALLTLADEVFVQHHRRVQRPKREQRREQIGGGVRGMEESYKLWEGVRLGPGCKRQAQLTRKLQPLRIG